LKKKKKKEIDVNHTQESIGNGHMPVGQDKSKQRDRK
jgi:hypothetical protein